jgi:hypothetical protein
MSIDYNNIVELVNILHKFVYEKEYTEQYMYNILRPEKININSIIKDSSFEHQFILNSSLERKDNFKVMTIIDNNYENLVNNSETKNKKLVLKKYFKNHPITIVIQKHLNKYEETLNMIDIYFELFMNQIISEYIINDKIPFFLLNICNFNINLDQIRVSKDFFDLVVEQYKLYDTNNKAKFCLSLYEHYHSYDTLSNLLKTELSDNELKSILFQTLFAYAYLNYKLTNFRHNYFCIDSFLVQKISKETTYYLRLGDLSFKLVNPKFICKLFNYRFSSIDGFKNIYETDLSNSTYDIYFFFKSLLDFKEIEKKNLEKIKIIISNFISYDLINSPLIDEIRFKTKYTFSIIPIHILSKNNFFVNFINMNSKSKEFNKKYSKNEEYDTLDEWGLDDGLPKKKTSKNKSKKGSLKKAKAADKKFSNYMTRVLPDKANQDDELIEGDDYNYKTPSDTGYKKKIKSKSKKNKVKDDSSVSSLSLEDGGLFGQKAQQAPVVKNKKNDMTRFLKNIGTNNLIPVIGEVQNMMDINQFQNNQVYSSDNGEAKIMDKGIYNLINSGKLAMPYVNSSMQIMPQQDPYQMMPQQDPYQMMPQQDPFQMMPQQDPFQMMPQQDPYQMMQQPSMQHQIPTMPPQMPMMQPQMQQMSQMTPNMFGAEEGMNKLEMPIVDLNSNNLLSDGKPTALNTNVNKLVGGSINDFFLKKKK